MFEYFLPIANWFECNPLTAADLSDALRGPQPCRANRSGQSAQFTPPVWARSFGSANLDLSQSTPQTGTLPPHYAPSQRIRSVPEGKGLLIVYTGPGKSNTICALGTAFRAVGQGLRVLMVQAQRPYSACRTSRSGHRNERSETPLHQGYTGPAGHRLLRLEAIRGSF